MSIVIWVLQGFIAIVFLYSGINKSVFSEQKLVAKGQTGVQGLPLPLIRFIGITEIAGAAGLILPLLFDKFLILIPVSAFCLGLIMVPAAVIHYKLREQKNVIQNIVIFILCMLIAYYRVK